MSIITSQLAGAGTVRVWSTGSKLDGQPGMYLESPNHHEENIAYSEIASFAPFPGGTSVATSSTVYGADLIVAGTAPGGQEVRKYAFERPAPDATAVVPKLLTTLPKVSTVAAPLAGR